ncbi:MAG: thioesterase family protein [Xanthomonadales bacterium]|nr:thioesterase family protein [Xanthomonadales bacterium]
MTEVSYARTAYPCFRSITTRWMDNDIYGHINNVQYYSYFDTVINQYLIEEGGLDIHAAEIIGVCIESKCTYRSPLAYPMTIEAGLRVGHLGNTSVRYEVGIFEETSETAAAAGYFVHVFVNRDGMEKTAIPPSVRQALQQLS